jgi:hypothetical protein
MPAGDRTGPWGLGPRTGRGFGFCSGYQAPGSMVAGPGFGRGYGRGLGLGRSCGRGGGFGRGRGFRNPWMAPFSGYLYPPVHPYGPPAGGASVPPGEEASFLAEQAGYLEEELGLIRKRLNELEAGKEKKKGEK